MRLLYGNIDLGCLVNWDFKIPVDTVPWTTEQQEDFINNLIEGCPIPQLVICTATRQMIDGCQVLEALKILAVRLDTDQSPTIRRSLVYWQVPYVDLTLSGKPQANFTKKISKIRKILNRGRV